ncbi:SMC-Scp complex subunit ScpB [Salinispira pacifica]|uniref:Segregation and condensation protein B n=1 Tax=Salinispira pacifica TaxID=1307761 RepID=V5WJ19_9SPIO|nr:SMC-Scp complex subunit ScpB [Salinispira pacifica]AHC15166.1 Segregation and condensation protein B [Salinispira pacifica]
MKLKTETALLEAILFLEPDPVHISSLAKISGLSKDAVSAVLLQLEELYTQEERGIELMRLGDSYQLTPKQSLWNNLKDRYGKQNTQRLSKAAMETLSIIAYSQPITRGEIESIRGVSSDSMIKLLQNRELIQEVGKKDAPGRPTQFGTTRTFLKVFRLSSIADLPKLDEVEQARFELHKDEL